MSKLENLNTKIEKARAEKLQKENRLKELEQQRKSVEKKERNHRLCKRMGHFEKLMPDTIPLTDEQFFSFLEKAVANDYGKRTLANIIAQGEKSQALASEKSQTPTGTTPQQNTQTPQPKPAADVPNGNTAGASQADGTKRSGG